MTNDYTDTGARTIAVVIALLFLTTVIIGLFLIRWEWHEPPIEDKGVAVRLSFGSTAASAPSTSQPDPQPQTSQTTTEKVVQQTESVAVPSDQSASESEQVSTKETKKTVKKEEEKPDKRLLDALEQLNNAESSDGKGPDQNNPGTEPLGGDMPGGGSFKLSGRKLKFFPGVDGDIIPEEGTVALQIQVDSKGNVLLARLKGEESTTMNSKLVSMAKKAALKTRFSAKTGVDEQWGTIYFHFSFSE